MRTMTRLIAALAGTAALAGAGSAAAAPTLFGGHYYEFVSGNFSWTDAAAAALTKTYFDGSTNYDGYLVSVTSDAENDFLGTLQGDGWIGATDQAVEGEWRWVGGPEAGQLFYNANTIGTITYAHWNGGEPNNVGNEDYAHRNGGGWNDLPNDNGHGYYVEYQARAVVGDGAIPEPATWAMMILGFGSAGVVVRNRRQRALA